jgi:hypothetical protein
VKVSREIETECKSGIGFSPSIMKHDPEM